LDAVDVRTAKAKQILATLKMNPKHNNLIGEALFHLFHQSSAIAKKYP